jgi:hypothetical protein
MRKLSYGSTHSEPRHYKAVSGQLQASSTLSPVKSPMRPFGNRLVGPQSWSGRNEEETLVIILRFLVRPARSLVLILTAPSRLHC